MGLRSTGNLNYWSGSACPMGVDVAMAVNGAICCKIVCIMSLCIKVACRS